MQSLKWKRITVFTRRRPRRRYRICVRSQAFVHAQRICMAIFQRDLEREGVLAIEKPMNYRLKK